MGKLTIEEINNTLKSIRKNILIDIDSNKIIVEINIISSEINKLRKQKSYLDYSEKMLDIIKKDYRSSLDLYIRNKKIPKLINDIQDKRNEIIRDILLKSEKLEKYELLLDFANFEDFKEIVKIRLKK